MLRSKASETIEVHALLPAGSTELAATTDSSNDTMLFAMRPSHHPGLHAIIVTSSTAEAK
jgi:hypothetical protein